jgi:plastocyanin
MKTNILIIIGIIAVLVIGGGIFLFMQSQPKGNESTIIPDIEIKSFAFSPSTLNINVGDTVVWENKDLMSHTITSDSGSELASESLGNSKTYSHTFNTAGTYDYHCSIHSSMKGKIIVT